MTHNRLEVYLHLVWATWDRLPLLTEAIVPAVYRTIGAKATTLGAEMVAIGGIEDHVHLLVRLPPTLTIADLVGQAKGASAYLVTHELRPGEFFRWQHAYGAFSVSPRQRARVAAYIARQREHHAADDGLTAWEETVFHTPSALAGGGQDQSGDDDEEECVGVAREV